MAVGLGGQEVRKFSGPPATLASRSGPASGSCQVPWRPPAKPPALSGPLPGHLPGFLHRFGRPRDLPRHEKPMIFMILSSKINVSRISTKSTFGITFGPLGEHFGHHFGRLCAPWGYFGRPLDSQSGAKVQKRMKKEGTNELLNRPGRPERPKGRQRAPRPSRMDPKSSKNKRNDNKTYFQQPTL